MDWHVDGHRDEPIIISKQARNKETKRGIGRALEEKRRTYLGRSACGQTARDAVAALLSAVTSGSAAAGTAALREMLSLWRPRLPLASRPLSRPPRSSAFSLSSWFLGVFFGFLFLEFVLVCFFSLPLLLFLPFYLSFLLILFCLHVFLLFPPFSPLRLENVSVYLDLSHSLCVSVCLSLYHSLPPSSSHLPPNALFLSHLLSLSSLSIYPPSPSSSLPHTLSSLSLSSSFFL